MLLLTSTTDQLQVVTSSAATTNVHASWVDTNTAAGTVTPGRTNTNIAAAATTGVAGSPVSGVQRNVKSLHVRNAHATLVNTITVQHTDGTTIAQLYQHLLNPGDSLEYTDQGGFSVTSGTPTPPVAVQVFTASGTYTPNPKLILALVECVGGGAAGGGQAGAVNWSYQCAGGG